MTEIKSFWDSQAKSSTLNDAEVTHRDVWQRWLEIEFLSTLLKPEERVIDVGCGTGYATKLLAQNVGDIVGIDYSEDMIERANTENPNKITFAVADVLNLSHHPFGLFDTAISVRCLINLADWDAQKKAILNIASVLKTDGRFLFVEGCADGRENLNQLRETVGLKKMPTVWHNRDFRRNELLEFLSDSFELEHELHFGTYDFISRIVHPLLVTPKEPNYKAKINEIAASLALARQDYGDISRTIILILRKK